MPWGPMRGRHRFRRPSPKGKRSRAPKLRTQRLLRAEWLEDRRLLAAIVRAGEGPDRASIDDAVAEFRVDLGFVNPTEAGSFRSGRRDIDWDLIPDAQASPHAVPANHFNTAALPLGFSLSTPGTGFEISADDDNPDAAPVRFGNINFTYVDTFSTFSSQRLFTPRGSNVTDVTFFVPGTDLPATVKGFGAVFSDVDLAGATTIEVFDAAGESLGAPLVVPEFDGGLSFLGVSFDAGERIHRVRITTGNTPLGPTATEDATTDVVVMDDFLYGEPIHVGDVFALDVANNLLRFDRLAPNVIGAKLPITGLPGAETMVAIDVQPSTGRLFGLGDLGNVYLIDEFSGIAELAQEVGVTLDGTAFDIDFDPLIDDALRIVSDTGRHLELRLDSGVVTEDDALSYAVGDTNEGTTPNIVGGAFTNSVPGAVSTSLYHVDSELDVLAIQSNIGDGILTTVGSLGFDISDVAGFDIQAASATAFAAFSVNGLSGLYTVDLENGVATLVDEIGLGDPIVDIAVMPGPTLSINDVTFVEGDAGTKQSVFTVSLSANNGDLVTVDYETVDGSALSSEDYTAQSGTLSFLPGETSQQIMIDVVGDTMFESDETFQVLLNAPVRATLAKATGLGTISNDDLPPPTLSIDDVTLAEGDAGETEFVFTVTLSAASDEEVTVDFSTAGVTAIAPNDYAEQNGTLSFLPGETSKQVTIAVAGDTMIETDETFQILLSGPTGATLAKATGVGTISNDDLPPPTLSIDNVMLDEGDAGETEFVFTVTLSAESDETVTVDFSTAGVTAIAPHDYTAKSGTLTFLPGETTKHVTIAVVGDTMFESDETFQVLLSGPTGATLAKATGVGTITNDDLSPPTLSIDDVSLAEGDAGTTEFVFTVTLSAMSDETVTVNFTTSSQTAADPEDYTAQSDTLTFAPGETTKQITIVVVGDAMFESDETFQVLLSGPSGATLEKATGVATITNDDPPPTLSIDDVTLAEGDAGETNFVFTVTLSAESSETVTVNFSTASLTAAAPDDYAAQSDTLSFAPGETTKQITIAVVGDMDVEPDETFQVVLAAPSGAVLDKATGVGTITNDDVEPLPTMSIDDVTLAEGDVGTTEFVFTVTLSAESSETVTVDFSTASLTAAAPNDYEAQSGSLTFLPSETTKTITVLVNGDVTHEADETFRVLLVSPSGATLAKAVGVGEIENDDEAPTATLSIDDVTLAEGDSGETEFVFTVTLSEASSQTVTVNFSTSSQTAADPEDYTAANGMLTFAPGVTEQQIFIRVKGDEDFEADETFRVLLASPVGAVLDKAAGQGEITNDDQRPTISIDDVTLAEGDSGVTAFMFTVTLSHASFETVTVRFAATDGTATAPDDYTTISDTLTFEPGQTSKTITVNVVGDAVAEANEVFSVQLFNPTQATIGKEQGLGTITDDDTAVRINIEGVAATEGNSGDKAFMFTVMLSQASTTAVTVAFATADGTALAASDYTAASGTLTFAAGETMKIITVNVQGDTTFEPDESFFVRLSNADGAAIDMDEAEGEITNDDTAPTISINDVNETEGDSGMKTFTFTVTLSNASSTAVSVDFTTADGTAVAPADYTSLTSGTLTFAPGETMKTIVVQVIGDTVVEGVETFTVNLSNASGATIADGSGTGTITDDDAAGVIAFAQATVSVNEAAGTVTIRVVRSGGSAGAVTVNFATSNGTALAGADFTATSGVLNFADGETEKTFTLVILDDVLDELNETLNLVLSSPTGGAVLGTVRDAVVTIVDNDDAPGNERFINQAYTDLLGRAAEPGGMTFYLNQINRGVFDRFQVALAIQHSPEFLGNMVEEMYRDLLGRGSDATGKAAHVSFLQDGGTRDRLLATFLGSAEYFRLHGGGQNGFLASIYQDVLGRGIDPVGQRTFSDLLDRKKRREPRTFAAAKLLESREADQREVQLLYQRFLGRGADAAGLNFHFDALQRAAATDHVIAGMVASNEYFNRGPR